MDVTARLPAVQQSVLERDIMSFPHQLSVRMIAGALHLSAVELAAQSAVRGIARAHRRPVGPSVHGTGAMLRAVGASVAAPTVVPKHGNEQTADHARPKTHSQCLPVTFRTQVQAGSTVPTPPPATHLPAPEQ